MSFKYIATVLIDVKKCKLYQQLHLWKGRRPREKGTFNLLMGREPFQIPRRVVPLTDCTFPFPNTKLMKWSEKELCTGQSGRYQSRLNSSEVISELRGKVTFHFLNSKCFSNKSTYLIITSSKSVSKFKFRSMNNVILFFIL